METEVQLWEEKRLSCGTTTRLTLPLISYNIVFYEFLDILNIQQEG